MENVNCIICDSEMSSPFVQVSDRFGDESFKIVKCVCGFKYLSPRPELNKIASYYENDGYEPHRPHKKSLFNKAYNWVQQEALKWKYTHISKFIEGGKLLDIGGGGGNFCSYYLSKHWEVALQDNSEKARLLAKEANIPTYTSLFEVENQKFDLITMWHSLEHIHEIEELFLNIDRLIKNDSVLVIAVPNVNAPERKWFKENWAPWDAPRHLYHFDYVQLSGLLIRYGWKIQQSKIMLQDTPYNILLSLKSKSIMQIGYAVLILLYSMFRIVIGGVNSSSSFMVICKKD